MARTVPKSLLEVLNEPGAQHGESASQSKADGAGGTDGGTNQPTRRRRRLPRWWLPAAAAAAVVATAVVFPVRSTIAVNELHRLDRRWAWYEALDGQRAHLEAQLAIAAVDPTDPRILRGRVALDSEEAPLLRKARAALLAGRHLPDGGLQRLRLAMAAALADQAADLDRGRVLGSAPQQAPNETQPVTSAAIFRVVDLLNAELARWRQQPVKRPVTVDPLVAANEQLAELAQPSDAPIDAGLVLIGPPGTLTKVDLAARRGEAATNRLTLPSTNPLTGPIVVRAGYLAVVSETTPFDTSVVYAVNPDLTGDPRVIGSTIGGVLVPGVDNDGIWVQAGNAVEEINGTGAVLHPPVPIGSNRTLVGVTNRLLVTTGVNISRPDSDLEIVPLQGPDQGHPSLLAARGSLVAATGGLMAWLDQAADGTVDVRLADGSAQGARTVIPPVLANLGPGPSGRTTARALPVDTGALSPDGSRLVLRGLTVADGGTDVQLLVIDVATGSIRLVAGSIGDHPAGPIVWSPAGDRVFFTAATRAQTHVATWQVDAPSPTAIRVPTPSLLALAVTGR